MIHVEGGTLSEKEVQAYVRHLQKAHPGREFTEITITLDGDYVNLAYVMSPIPFERIRRITGYLVGTLDRFNNAKRAEVEDRVKHSVGGAEELGI